MALQRDELSTVRRHNRSHGTPMVENISSIPTTLQASRTLPAKKKTEYNVKRLLRLNAEVDRKLDELSRKEGVSIDVLANKAIRRLVEWDYPAKELGILSTQRDTLRFLWDSLPEQKARSMGKKAGGQNSLEFHRYWFKKFSWETLVEGARIWGAEYGGVYHFQHDFADGVHTLVFFHDLGRNFTAYTSEAFQATLKLLVADFEVTESDKQLILRVKR